MVTYANTLGMTQPGLAFLNNAGQTQSITSTGSGILVSTGANSYAINPTTTPSISGVVAQIVSDNPPSSNVSPVVSGSSAYDVAQQFLFMNITPVYASSTYFVDFTATIMMNATLPTGAIIGINGFLNAAGTRILFNQVNDGSGVQNFTVPMAATATFSTGSLTPFTFNWCVQSTQTTTSTALLPHDAFTIIELNPTNYVTLPPNLICVSTSSTPVTSFTLPTPLSGASIMYRGYQSFIDQANINSNLATFSLVVQQPGNPATTAPTIAANTVFYDSNWSFPTLTFTPVVGGILAQVIGINGSTFICQNYVTSVPS